MVTIGSEKRNSGLDLVLDLVLSGFG